MAETLDAPEIADERLATVFSGPLAYCASQLALGGEADLLAADLLHGDALHSLLACFAERYPGGDRRAVASLWAQWYFGSLLVPATALLLRLRRELPLLPDQVGVRLDPHAHHAVGVRLPDAGEPAPDADAFELFHDLVWLHLDPLVERIARTAGVSRRLLWSSAGGYVEWTARQLETQPGGAAAAAEGDRLTGARRWPDGRANPLFQPVRYVEDHGETVRRRRVCCLRYLLPGLPGCGKLCPLPRICDAG